MPAQETQQPSTQQMELPSTTQDVAMEQPVCALPLPSPRPLIRLDFGVFADDKW
jgi:hypothetical protein